MRLPTSSRQGANPGGMRGVARTPRASLRRYAPAGTWSSPTKFRAATFPPRAPEARPVAWPVFAPKPIAGACRIGTVNVNGANDQARRRPSPQHHATQVDANDQASRHQSPQHHATQFGAKLKQPSFRGQLDGPPPTCGLSSNTSKVGDTAAWPSSDASSDSGAVLVASFAFPRSFQLSGISIPRAGPVSPFRRASRRRLQPSHQLCSYGNQRPSRPRLRVRRQVPR